MGLVLLWAVALLQTTFHQRTNTSRANQKWYYSILPISGHCNMMRHDETNSFPQANPTKSSYYHLSSLYHTFPPEICFPNAPNMLLEPRAPGPSFPATALLGVVRGRLHGRHPRGELRGLGVEEQGQQLGIQVQRPQMWMGCLGSR